MLGEAYSLADPYAFVVCCWLEGDGVPLADFPALQAFMTTMTNRPAVQAVINKGMIAP